MNKKSDLHGHFKTKIEQKLFHLIAKRGMKGGRRGIRSQSHGGGFDDEDISPIKRLLGHGDLRFVILFFLKERPRHGYEIIKLLEEHSSGEYTPSPGVIYPTLTFLEEAGYATSETVENKKQFSITNPGREFLKENEEMVKHVLARMAHVGRKLSRLKNCSGQFEDQASGRKEEQDPVRGAIRDFKAEMGTFFETSDETKKKLAKLINETVEQMKKLKHSK